MKKIILILAAIASLSQLANAQQDPLYTQYVFNMLTVNPGYAGSRDALTLNVLHRNQWVGIEGAPVTNSFSIHSPLRNENLNIGFSYVNDNIGPTNQNGVYVDFAARIQLSKKSRLSFGLKSGFNHLQTSLTALNITDPGDITFSEDVRRFMPNVGVGMYFDTERFYAGISIPKFFENRFVDNANATDAQERRHFFFITGAVFDLSRDIKFKPSILLKGVEAAPLSADLNLSFLFRDRIWAGGYYRFGDSFGGIIGYYITPQLMFGYSYDYTTTDLQNFNSGSHEISLTYDFDFKNQKVRSPRYF